MTAPNERELAEILVLLDDLAAYIRKLESWDEDEATEILQQIKEYLGA